MITLEDCIIPRRLAQRREVDRRRSALKSSRSRRSGSWKSPIRS